MQYELNHKAKALLAEGSIWQIAFLEIALKCEELMELIFSQGQPPFETKPEIYAIKMVADSKTREVTFSESDWRYYAEFLARLKIIKREISHNET